MNKKNVITSLLENFEDSKIIDLWNEYCAHAGNNKEIYHNCSYSFEIMFGNNIDEALRASFYGNYDYTDIYVKFDAYGNLESFNRIRVEINYDDLADYIMEVGCPEINEVWFDDIYAYFIDWFNDEYNQDINVDDEDNSVINIVLDWDLVSSDWEDVANDILEKMKD